MVGFYRYETKSLTITVSGGDGLTDYSEVVVSLRQKKTAVQIDLTNEDLTIDAEAGTIMVNLSQEQTAMFSVGPVVLQVNIYYADTNRSATAQAIIGVKDNAYAKVMGDE